MTVTLRDIIDAFDAAPEPDRAEFLRKVRRGDPRDVRMKGGSSVLPGGQLQGSMSGVIKAGAGRVDNHGRVIG